MHKAIVLACIVLPCFRQSAATRDSEDDRKRSALTVSISSSSRGKVVLGSAISNETGADGSTADRLGSQTGLSRSHGPDKKGSAPEETGSVDPLSHCSDRHSVKCVVDVAVILKRWIAFSDKDETFTADFVLSAHWKDERASKLVPKGETFITLDQAAASKSLWNPDITVTNRAIRGVETISWELKVLKGGDCTLVHRMIAIVQQGLDITAYPFDVQDLKLQLASPKTFSDELTLRLTPAMRDRTVDAVSKELFSTSRLHLLNWQMKAADDVDELMTRSRVVLTLTVERNWERAFEVTMIPELFMIGVSWLVLWFPRLPNFSMPKAAAASISLLTLITLRIKTIDSLPNSRPRACWLEGWEEACVILTVFTMCLNVFMEIVYHKWEMPNLAETMSQVAKATYPTLFSIVFFTCWTYIGLANATCIKTMMNINRVTVVVFFVAFVGYFRNEGNKGAEEAATPQGDKGDADT